jgi:hypothetical protein
MVRTRRLVLMLLALMVLCPLALYTSCLSVALNPIRKRALSPDMICFEIRGRLLLALALLRILLPRFFISRKAGFLCKNHESGE